ncbi:serine/threonine protein kinase [Streptomyces sp. NRRL F-2664]|uniref:serine/threonine protein kinase n=1 Tax=Streptomyces sp. NRRL F-2664 TaxID=1463842 RepID=UPI0005BAF055|nr:serine/threonine protein kinase [Streptomyces sp. NRRL F-2664]
MEALRHDDPRRVGAYTVLARFDADPETSAPERAFVVRSGDGDTLLARLPRPGVDPARWAVEAEGARRLAVSGFLTVGEVGGGAGEPPWCAGPYVPALTLPAALRAHGGPLPDPVVRALGAALARTLATAHAQGVTHAGLSPSAVLLTTDGPRLRCYGAVRAAAPDGERRDGLPGLDSGSLAPEPAAGGRPQPPGDVYALGAVLAYAATGHTVPERDELPAFLREPVTACLSRDPDRRPQAHQLLMYLEQAAYEATPPVVTAAPTASPSPPASAAAAPAPLPLPASVVVALARQSAEVLAAEPPLDASRTYHG